MSACPPDCIERHNSNSKWIGSSLQLICVLFAALGGLYLYGASSYASASSLEETKTAIKEQRNEIREELKAINLKLDAMADRTARSAKSSQAP
jgi:hypothetical protein